MRLLSKLMVSFGMIAMASLAGAVFNSSPANAAITSTYCGSVRGYAKVEYSNIINFGTSPYFSTVRYGNTGNCVKAIQRELNADFCSSSTKLVVDGKYGPKTWQAVYRYQQMMRNQSMRVDGSSISVDGVVGKQTFALLNEFSYPSGGPVVFTVPIYSC